MPPRTTVVLVLLLGALAASLAPLPVCAGGYKRGHGKTHEEKQAAINISAIYTGATARPMPVRSLAALPAHFDWCDVDGKSYCTASWNQHIPKYQPPHTHVACRHCCHSRAAVLIVLSAWPTVRPQVLRLVLDTRRSRCRQRSHQSADGRQTRRDARTAGPTQLRPQQRTGSGL